MYIPVLKNRTVEVSVLQQLSQIGVFDHSIIPLVELIQERTRSNMKNTFFDELISIMEAAPNMRVMLDFYKSTRLRNTSDAIREYITRTVRQPDFFQSELYKIVQFNDRVIPVLSYIPETVSIERLYDECQFCQRFFQHVAFRLKPQEFDFVFGQVSAWIRQGDYVILDIETASYTSPVFKSMYKKIADLKRQTGCISIVIKAHRPEDLANNRMLDEEPIGDIDNGLKDLYSSSYMSRFDGFGDYACVTASLPTTGGAISPVGIYYSAENNFFVSFRARQPVLSEFPEYIVPSIMSSGYWHEFNDGHHRTCPGCLEIRQIADGVKSGKNQAQWKMITMLHYIFAMYEMNA